MCLQLIYFFKNQNLIFVADDHVYKQCGDVDNEAIIMPQFVDNAVCFV